MTTLPERPHSIEELPTVIQQVQHTSLHLDQYQEEYKRRIGLSGTVHDNLLFHPEAVREELKDKQELLQNLKNKYVDLLTKQKFLECILQEPPINITHQDLHDIGKENDFKLAQINSVLKEKDTIGNTIKSTISTIEAGKEDLKSTIDDVEKAIGDIITMEEEFHRIQTKLKNKSELTVEEAEKIISRQTDQLTQLAKSNDDQKDMLEEHRWDIVQKEKKLEEVKLYANQMQNEAKQAMRAKESQTEDIDTQYREYKEAIDMYNCVLFGAKSIDFSSEDVIHVTFDDKYNNAVLHIYIDYEVNKVAHLTIDGPNIDLDSTLRLAQRSAVNDGVKTAILETLNRLKKR